MRFMRGDVDSTCRPLCSRRRADRIKVMSVHGTSRTWRDVRLESVVRSRADISKGCSAADRLQEHGVPVEIKELLLTTGECAHVDHFCCLNTHPLKRRAIRHWRKKRESKNNSSGGEPKRSSGQAGNRRLDQERRKSKMVTSAGKYSICPLTQRLLLTASRPSVD